MKSALLIILPAILVGCGNHDPGNMQTVQASSRAPVSLASLQAYQTTLYTFGQNQNCVKCHVRSVSPAWQNSDLETAYRLARPLVDFSNPTASVFATYVANNHCADVVCTDSANVAIVKDLLVQWANAELVQSGGALPPGTTLPNPPYRTSTLAMPATIPSIFTATPAVIRFDLSQLSPAVPALSGAILELSVQMYNSTEYKIFNPRLVGNSAPTRLQGIHIYIRPSIGSGLGTEDIYQGDLWAGANVLSPIRVAPMPMPTGPMTSILPLLGTSLGVQLQSAADVITIGFAAISL